MLAFVVCFVVCKLLCAVCCLLWVVRCLLFADLRASLSYAACCSLLAVCC